LSPWNIIKIKPLPIPSAALIAYNWLRPMG